MQPFGTYSIIVAGSFALLGCPSEQPAADPDAEPTGTCSDGVVDDGEQCDDQNLESDDGCSELCQTETPAWRLVASSGPGAIGASAMAFDAAREQVVRFGGGGGPPLDRDTSTWDGASWANASTTGPSGRENHAMAYDGAREQVVLFGGFDVDWRGDTWTWTGSEWTLAADTGPPGRVHHAMAYDDARQKIVMYGGFSNQQGRLHDTWEWDGLAWVQQATTGPQGHEYAAMAYDRNRGTTVLFGGYDGVTSFGDTWEWDGSTWTQIQTPGDVPPARQWHAMVYDEQRERVVMFGGFSWSDAQRGMQDTWEWDGASWTQTATDGPSARWWHSMAYDSSNKTVVVYAGFSDDTPTTDTWVYGFGS